MQSFACWATGASGQGEVTREPRDACERRRRGVRRLDLNTTRTKTLIATQLPPTNSVASSVVVNEAGEGGEPGHIGVILVSSYVSARIAMFAMASSGS